MAVGRIGKLFDVQHSQGRVGNGLPKTALVLGRKAALSSSAVQSGSTKVNSMPMRFMVTANRL